MSETCNSRGFSRLMKSCFPDTTQLQPISLIKLSDRNQRTNFSSLPDDLLLDCLSRAPLSSLPSISLVCRKWCHLLDSSTFYHLRRSRNLLSQTIFAFSISDIALHIAKQHESGWQIASIQDGSFSLSFSFSLSHSRLIPIGKYVFILNRNFTLRLNTWTGNLSSRCPMLYPRKKFAAAKISGKIYVSGGTARTATVEEYNPETDTWRIVSESPRRRFGCIGASINGVFYIIGGLKINTRTESTREASTQAREYASSMDLYDVETRVWLRSRVVPSGGCIVAACAVGGHVYVLTSHAVELSFWRFDGRRKKNGEWCRMKSPPLPAQVRVDNTVRFCFVGVGEEKVVLIQVMGCIDDLLRRSGRSCRGFKEGLVLVYDCEIGEWGRDFDLPCIIRRGACVCVEC